MISADIFLFSPENQNVLTLMFETIKICTHIVCHLYLYCIVCRYCKQGQITCLHLKDRYH